MSDEQPDLKPCPTGEHAAALNRHGLAHCGEWNCWLRWVAVTPEVWNRRPAEDALRHRIATLEERAERAEDELALRCDQLQTAEAREDDLRQRIAHLEAEAEERAGALAEAEKDARGVRLLRAIYDNEQNCRLESFWDGGWTGLLGDQVNGFTGATRECDDPLDAIEWLAKTVGVDGDVDEVAAGRSEP